MENSDVHTELSPYSQELLDAVIAAIPTWLSARISSIAPEAEIDWSAVVGKTLEYVKVQLSTLLTTDVDHQRANPLHVLRQSTVFVTTALKEAGVAPVRRDDFDQQSMPDDIYAFGPLTWRDLSEEAHEAGISWGAWKAATVLTRRREEGKLT